MLHWTLIGYFPKRPAMRSKLPTASAWDVRLFKNATKNAKMAISDSAQVDGCFTFEVNVGLLLFFAIRFRRVLWTTAHDSVRSPRKIFTAALVHRRGGKSAEVFWPSLSASFPSLRCHRVFLLVAAWPRWVLCGFFQLLFPGSCVLRDGRGAPARNTHNENPRPFSNGSTRASISKTG